MGESHLPKPIDRDTFPTAPRIPFRSEVPVASPSASDLHPHVISVEADTIPTAAFTENQPSIPEVLSHNLEGESKTPLSESNQTALLQAEKNLEEVLYGLEVRDQAVTLTSVLEDIAQEGYAGLALKLADRVQWPGIKTRAYTSVALALLDQKKDPTDAIKRAETSVSQNPNDSHGIWQLAEIQARLGNLDYAVALLDRGATDAILKDNYVEKVVLALIKDGQMERANVVLEQHTVLQESKVKTKIKAGFITNFDQLQETADELVLSDWRRNPLYTEFAKSSISAGRPEEAYKAADAAKVEESFALLAQIGITQHELDQPVQETIDRIQQKIDNPDIYSRHKDYGYAALIQIYADMGQLEQALQYLQQMSPHHGTRGIEEADMSLIKATCKVGRFTEAIEFANRLHRQHPKSKAYETIAKSQAKAGLIDEALQTAENLEEDQHTSERQECKIAIAAIQLMNIAGNSQSLDLLSLYQQPDQNSSTKPFHSLEHTTNLEADVSQDSFQSLRLFKRPSVLLSEEIRENLTKHHMDLNDASSEADEVFEALSPEERERFADKLNELVQEDLIAVILNEEVDTLSFLQNVSAPRIVFLKQHNILDVNPYAPKSTAAAFEKKYRILEYLKIDKYKNPVSAEHEEQVASIVPRLIHESVFLKKYNLGGLVWNPQVSRDSVQYNTAFFTRFLQRPSHYNTFGIGGEQMVQEFLKAANVLEVDTKEIFDERFVREVQRNITGYYGGGHGNFEAFAQLLPIADIVAPEEFCSSEELQSSLGSYLEQVIKYRDDQIKFKDIRKVVNFYRVNIDRVLPSIWSNILQPAIFQYGKTDFALQVLDDLEYSNDFSDYKHFIPPHIQTAFDLADIDSWEKIKPFYDKNIAFIQYLESKKDEGSILTKADLPYIAKLNQDLFRAEQLKREGVDFAHVVENDDYKSLIEGLKRVSVEYQIEEDVTFFEQGANDFGYKRMYNFTQRPGLSLHAAVHAWENIMHLADSSMLDKTQKNPDGDDRNAKLNKFYANILDQVVRDNSTYSAGTANHQLNEIAKTLNLNFDETREKAAGYVDEIPELSELAYKYNTPQAIFSSWHDLKTYSKLTQLLEKTYLLDELKELKATGNETLYKYIVTLALHPTSKVNMDMVFQFWKNPEHFLSAFASYTPPEIHDRKKPSNYIEIPNLDLTATELRDALVEGKMDAIQAFTPMEITYNISNEEVPPLRERVKKAFSTKTIEKDGKQIETTFPYAKNKKELFRQLQGILQKHGLTINEYLNGADLPTDQQLTQSIEALIYDKGIGMQKPKFKYETIVATLHTKSSPEAVIAGNDTASCDTFGDGKKTLYMFNPNTATFTVQIVRNDGSKRTIAQSTLTKDKDIKMPIPEVMQRLHQEKAVLYQELPEDLLRNTPSIIACDNIELAENFIKSHATTITDVYRDFFREYTNRFADEEHLDPTRVVIGLGYTTALNIEKIQNTFAPLAPMSYSDKTGAEVFVLDLESDQQAMQKQVYIPEILPTNNDAQLPLIRGLSYLNFEDTLPVAYIEGKAYADNPELMTFLSNMENALIAKDINNAAKGRPNMSVKYSDSDGKVRGYLLSYEGTVDDTENTDLKNQSVVYITDLATDREHPLAGGRLIQGFTELYMENYIKKGKNIPIYAQARESTSYRILQRQLDRIAKDLGVQFELKELPTYDFGGEKMHPVIIRPLLQENYSQ